MAGKVVWADTALRDLDQVAAYIASDSPYYAAAFVKKIRTAARALRSFPRLGRILPELERESIRELIIGNYRLIYQVREDSVEVVPLIHGARDLQQSFPPRKVE